MKYGYNCKFCGFTINSDDKKAVKEAKQRHNAHIRVPGMFLPVRVDCSLTATKRGTLIRTQLAY